MPQLKDTEGQIGWSQDLSMCYIPETHLTCKNTHRLKIKNGGKFTKQMESRKKAGIVFLVSDKTDFKPTKIKKDKEGHYIMVKGSIQQEELTIYKKMYQIKEDPDS